jgi:hypothetical protein
MIEMLIARIIAMPSLELTCWPAERWRVECAEGVCQVHAVGWHALDRMGRVECLRNVLMTSAADPAIKRLVWAASGVELDRSAIIACAARWQETGDAPVLDLIALDVAAVDAAGRSGVVSRGLAEIVGIEIEAISSNDYLRHQTTLVARMIAYVLSTDRHDGTTVKDQFGKLREFRRLEHGYFTANPVISFGLPVAD